jgi:hypothetical protein
MTDRTETVLQAFALAATGQLEEAERLLGTEPDPSASPMELDLLARIAVHRGDDARAKTLWERVLETDPRSPTAHEALRRLRNHWRQWETIRKIAVVALPGILLLATVIVGVKYIRSRATVVQQATRIEDIERTLAAVPPALKQDDFTIPGCTTTTLQDGDIRIELPPAGPSAIQLRSIGIGISKRAGTCFVIAEMPRNLGQLGKRTTQDQSLRRATVLAECLAELSGLPTDQFAVWNNPNTNSPALALRITRRISDLP